MSTYIVGKKEESSLFIRAIALIDQGVSNEFQVDWDIRCGDPSGSCQVAQLKNHGDIPKELAFIRMLEGLL